MEIKEITKVLNITMTEYFKLSSSNKDKIYHVRKNKNETEIKKYNLLAISNYYNIEEMELIKILELYTIQKKQ